MTTERVAVVRIHSPYPLKLAFGYCVQVSRVHRDIAHQSHSDEEQSEDARASDGEARDETRARENTVNPHRYEHVGEDADGGGARPPRPQRPFLTEKIFVVICDVFLQRHSCY